MQKKMYYSNFCAITQSVHTCVTAWLTLRHNLSLLCNYRKPLFQGVSLCPAVVLVLHIEFLKTFPQTGLQSIRSPISSLFLLNKLLLH